MESKTSSKANIRLALLSPVESNAPHFIRLSMVFLLANLESILFTRSVRFLYGPLASLSATILSIAFAPTFFTAARPNLIWSPSTENFEKDLLISGGNTPIPIELHSLMYSTTLSLLPMIDVIKAAINSTG